MVRIVAAVGGLALGLGVACTPVERSTPQSAAAVVETPAAPTVAPPPGRVITTLQTRDHEVTVYGTDSGPRFTVAAAGGVVLAQYLSADEFRESFPGLHRRYDTAFADEERGLDASALLPELAGDRAAPGPGGAQPDGW